MKALLWLVITILIVVFVYVFFIDVPPKKKIVEDTKRKTLTDRAAETTEETVEPGPSKPKPRKLKPKPDSALNVKLFEAVKSADASEVKKLINMGADASGRDKYKRSVLWLAFHESKKRSKKIILLLIEKRADLTYTGSEQNCRTPLHWASGEYGDKDIIKAMVERGADLNARSRYERLTPLHHAVMFNHDDRSRFEIVKLLIDSGANVNIQNREGKTPIKISELYNRKSEANYMRKHGKKGPVVQVAKTEYTHITSAAAANQLDAIKYLLKKGVDINQAGVDGTALHIALTKKYTDIAKFLIENGADINAKNKDGRTPLMIAQTGYLMKLLINKGADVNVRDSWSRSTPLHRAVSKGDKKLVELLLSKGAETKVKTKHGGTPFEFAIDRYDRDIMKLLIKSGADVNAKVRLGIPLLEALNKKDPAMAKLLISKGADVNITSNSDNSKITALHLAVMGGYKDLVQLMLEKGADVNAKDSVGRNAMGYARYAKPKVRNKIMALLTSKSSGTISSSEKALDKLVTITGQNITLKQALSSFKRQTNLKIKIHKGVDLQRKMGGLNLKNYSAEKALHWIGKMYKVRIEVKKSRVHVFAK